MREGDKERVHRVIGEYLEWESIPGSAREKSYYLLTDPADVQAIKTYVFALEQRILDLESSGVKVGDPQFSIDGSEAGRKLWRQAQARRGMFHTGLEALPDGGDVRVWYEDGDLAATVCGNLGLGIDPLEATEAVLAALRNVTRHEP